MIVVVEGISAAGKTTYSRQVAERQCIPEFEPMAPQPSAEAPVVEHAEFWVAHNIRRFKAAIEAEQEHGFALCDTDPLKSHFDWCRARAGQIPMDMFDCARPLIRRAIEERRLGFADRYLVKHIEPERARAQKQGDKTRSRRRFEMHLSLQPHLIDWFEALSQVLPGQVKFDWPAPDDLLRELESKAPEENPRRFDVSVFDQLVECLPN